MRTPHDIAADAQALADQAAHWCVPVPHDQVAALSIEFMTSLAECFADAVAQAVAAALHPVA